MSRSYCALYVDVGYLLSASASRVAGSSLRSGVIVDHGRLIQQLIRHVDELSDLPLLRVNWYDSGRRNGSPDDEQDRIGRMPKVKLRLGRLSYSGEQKGVDLRIGLDLVSHARNRVADVVYLLSGDDDLTEAVEEAQQLGAQVIVLAVPDTEGKPHGVARHLWREADDVQLVDAEIIDDTVFRRETPEPAEPVASAPAPAPTPAAPDRAPAAKSPGSGTPSAPTPAAMPSRPSPASMPSRRVERPAPTVPVLPDLENVDPALLVTQEEAAAIDQVARGVVTSWFRTSTPAAQQALRDTMPSIPADLDRALLVDLSQKLGQYEISDPARLQLRSRFWEVVQEM